MQQLEQFGELVAFDFKAEAERSRAAARIEGGAKDVELVLDLLQCRRAGGQVTGPAKLVLREGVRGVARHGVS